MTIPILEFLAPLEVMRARKHASTRRLHQENREDVPYLLRPRAHAETGQSMVLNGGLRRAEEIVGEVEEASVPRTKWIQSELQCRW
jgi:hypothetical protein